MIDFSLSPELAEFTRTYLRPIVFTFIGAQIVVSSLFIWFSQRKWTKTKREVFTSSIPSPFWKGLRLAPKSPLDLPMLIGFGLILSVYIWLIIDRAELCYPDQSHITAGALKGKLWMQVQPWIGRLSPLLHQEYLFISHFLKNAAGYYVYASFLLIIFCFACLGILDPQSLAVRLGFLCSLIISSAFAVPISGLIFPEINILFALMMFIGCASVFHHYRTSTPSFKRWAAGSGMIISSTYLIYVKEPFFLVFFIYSLLSVFSNRANLNLVKTVKGKLRLGEATARWAPEIAILLVTALYGLIYLIYAFLQTKVRYGSTQSSGFTETMICSLQSTPWVGIYLIALIGRAVLIGRKVCKFDPVVDSLAYAFLGYYSALLVLGLKYSYYYLPVAFIAVVLVSKTAANVVMRKAVSIVIVGVSLLFVFVGIRPALDWFAYRDLYMQSRVLMSDALAQALRVQTGNGNIEIFFLERVKGYDRGEFIAFLNHRAEDRTFIEAGKVPVHEDSMSFLEVAALPAGELPEGSLTMQKVREVVDQRGSSDKKPKIFVALPDQSGRNIKLQEKKEGEVPESDQIRVIEIIAECEPFKKYLLSFFGVGTPDYTTSYILTFYP